MKPRGAALVAAALVLASGGVDAEDARYLASVCANCHGTDGHAVPGQAIPGLAGLPRAYIVEQMNAFRAGARQATVMHQLAPGFTDRQIAVLADYFSRQQAR